MSVKKIKIKDVLANSGVNERLINKEFGKKLREFRKSMDMSKEFFGKSILPKGALYSSAINLIEKGSGMNNKVFFKLQEVYVKFGDSIYLINRYRAGIADLLLKEIDVSGDIYKQYIENTNEISQCIGSSIIHGFSDCLNDDHLDGQIIHLRKKEAFFEKDLQSQNKDPFGTSLNIPSSSSSSNLFSGDSSVVVKRSGLKL